jgi:O-methyltransferase
MSALWKLFKDPVHYLPIARKVLLQRLTPLFQGRSFFLQSQMDIHPMARWRSNLTEKTGGFYIAGDPIRRAVCDLEPYDNTRRDMLVLLMRTIIEKGVAGSFAELGVYQGNTARLIHHYAPDRALHLFDTFEGFTGRGAGDERHTTGEAVDSRQFSDTSLDLVRAKVAPQNGNVTFHRGFFPDSVPAPLGQQPFAFVHLDADLYGPTLAGLNFFYPRLSRHGVLVVHDYNAWIGARTAVDEFFLDKPELPVPMPDVSGSVVIVKA